MARIKKQVKRIFWFIEAKENNTCLKRRKTQITTPVNISKKIYIYNLKTVFSAIKSNSKKQSK